MSFKFINRLFRHLFIWPGSTKKYFSPAAMARISAAIVQSEHTHWGEIFFVIEVNLPIWDVFRNKSAQQRAVEIFAQTHVWDTELNNGVLIYLLLADHHFEILADRGIHHHVGPYGWEKVCREMEQLFLQGEFESGIMVGIGKIGAHLKKHFPGNGEKINELSDTPLIL